MVFITIIAAAYPGYEAEQSDESHWAMTDQVIDPETDEPKMVMNEETGKLEPVGREPTGEYMAWIFLTYMIGSIIVVFWPNILGIQPSWSLLQPPPLQPFSPSQKPQQPLHNALQQRLEG